MPRFAYLTPAQAAGAYVCRLLRIPTELVPAVNGALSELTKEWNWEAHESMTVEEAVDLCQDMIDTYWSSGDACMIGSIQPYVTTALPDGVLACDGSQYARVDYPILYSMLDASLIVDADNFVTPDLRGRAVIGTGQGTGLTNRAFGDIPGSETHHLTIAEIPNHAHQYNSPGLPDIVVVAPGEFPAQSTNTVGTTTFVGGGGAHENMPPSYALTWGLVAK